MYFFDNIISVHSLDIMNLPKLPTQDIMNSYMSIVYDYVDAYELFIAKGDVIYPDCMFYIGLNIINKVYVYILMKQCNVKPASYYSQKAYVYFIEYMEQIHLHGLALTINHNDAIMFIYKKTIFETNSDNQLQSTTDTMSNIFSLQPIELICNMNECISLLHDAHRYINTILNWDNITITTTNRIYICKRILPSLIRFTRHFEITVGYLEYIHIATTMSFTKYCELLDEISQILSIIPNMCCKTVEKFVVQKCYIDRDILCKKMEENSIHEVVAWLYEPIRK
jgi:hypothetical protein